MELEQRVSRLEGSAKRWRLAVVVLAAMMVGAVLMGQRGPRGAAGLIGVAGANEFLFAVYSDGNVRVLKVHDLDSYDEEQSMPGWETMPIDLRHDDDLSSPPR